MSKIIQVGPSGSTQTAYWPTAIQPKNAVSIEALAGPSDTIICRPDLIQSVNFPVREVWQIKSRSGAYAGTTGRFFCVAFPA